MPSILVTNESNAPAVVNIYPQATPGTADTTFSVGGGGVTFPQTVAAGAQTLFSTPEQTSFNVSAKIYGAECATSTGAQAAVSLSDGDANLTASVGVQVNPLLQSTPSLQLLVSGAQAGGYNYTGVTATTATAGGGAAVPATVLGFINWQVNGVSVKIPYFSA